MMLFLVALIDGGAASDTTEIFVLKEKKTIDYTFNIEMIGCFMFLLFNHDENYNLFCSDLPKC